MEEKRVLSKHMWSLEPLYMIHSHFIELAEKQATWDETIPTKFDDEGYSVCCIDFSIIMSWEQSSGVIADYTAETELLLLVDLMSLESWVTYGEKDGTCSTWATNFLFFVNLEFSRKAWSLKYLSMRCPWFLQ